MLYIAPYDWEGIKAWFVRFKWYPDGTNSEWHGKLFNWAKYATPNDALDAARAYRNTWLADHQDRLWLRGGGGFNTALPRNNTSGILGVNRVTRKLPSGNMWDGWQTTYRLPDGSDENRKFAVMKHGELGAMKLAIEARRNGLIALKSIVKYATDGSIDDLVDYYDDILANIADLADNTPGRSLLEIVRDENITGTTKFEEIRMRVGQQRFRRSVLQFFEFKCAITGSSQLIRASHIKPWRAASDDERLDPMNGLALSPTYDAAFDFGLISFRSDGMILIAPGFREDAKRLGISGEERVLLMTDKHVRYLSWHREHLLGSARLLSSTCEDGDRAPDENTAAVAESTEANR